MSVTTRFEFPEITSGQAQKEVVHNEGLWMMDGLLNCAVESRLDESPPSSYSEGELWLIPDVSAAGGDWGGHEGEIAHYFNSAWYFYTPVEGQRIWVKDEDIFLVFDGAAWQDFPTDFDAFHDDESGEIHLLTQKTALVDNDEFLGENSENSYSKIRILWSSIKSVLKTYFDTLYLVAATTSNSGIVELATEAEHETGTSEALAATPYGVTVIVRDVLRDAVEAATGGQVTILRDDLDNPSWMVIIPKFRCGDVDVSGTSALGTGVHPAFIVNGTEKNYFMVGQYQASLASGRGVSIPGVDPAASLDFDDASGYCTAKGSGWHLITNWEWSAIALWCLANGYQPRGNTYYGRSYLTNYLHECGRRQDGEEPGLASGTARTYTGSGPNTWRHNNAANGVSDLVGNIWECCDGLKLVDGLIYMPSDNYYNLAEASWPSTTVYMDGTGTGGSGDVGDVRLNSSVVNSSGSTAYFLNAWTATGVSEAGYTSMSTAVKQQMMRACIDPTFDTTNPVGSIYCKNSGELLPSRGGHWYSAANAGLFALNLNNVREHTSSSIGFRLAYMP